LSRVRAEGRPATPGEQQVLARWSSWGAVPQVFEESRQDWAPERARLRAVLDDVEYAAARRATINAHFTDAAYVEAVWAAMGRLGFTGGQVLEPGSGSGTFIGMAPGSAQVTGVELDPTSAAISQALYPWARIRVESFARTRLPAGYFDAVVGNVPFGEVVLHDPGSNRGGHSLHNHFIIKSLELTRPGGLVAVLTSRYTLDSVKPATCREMAAMADLVGAVRLPNGAHRRAAGTEVVTDVLLLRRREPGAPVVEQVWETTAAVLVDGQRTRINNYFVDHPELVLGDLALGQGAYSATELSVRGDLPTAPQALAQALGRITDAAAREGLTFTDRPADERPPDPAALVPAGSDLWDGHLGAAPDGTFTVVRHGVHEPVPVPRAHAGELRELLGLRDAAKNLLAAEAATVEDTADLEELRARLNGAYAGYAARFGPINRFTTRATGRVDAETGEPRTARVTPRVMTLLRSDPFAPLVRALENFDETSQTATPATLLRQRVVLPRRPVLGADTAADALAITLEATGRVDLTDVGRLLGVDQAEAREQLAGLVFHDPARDELVSAAQYLSGNVRTKLEQAQAALAGLGEPTGPGGPDRRRAAELEANIEALRAVVPPDLGLDDIEARLGAVWIDTDTHRQFLVELLGDPSVRVEHPGAAMWEVRGASGSVAARSEWGTERMPAHAIVKTTLEQRPVQVTDEIEEGRRALNSVETAAAQEKAEAIQNRFAEWVWEEPGRAARLANEYNRRFNALVLRDYTAEGERLTLPGLATTFTPRPHQRTAVARMLAEPAVGLFHQVGAGKTAEMVMGTMELKRLGMAAKPAVVVPNHMLEQFSREWLQLYPRARLLAASSGDLAGDRRRQFVARAATNDWDAVIMTRSAFERIPLSAGAQAEYLGREVAGLRRMLENARSGGGLSVKRLEKMVMAGEQRAETLMDAARDAGLTFEETGIDYLVVDELHDYKNLRTPSNIRDAAIAGSKRATDLHMKTDLLRERHGERVITGATATPIANSITEAHVMQRYLRPDLLREAGVEDFDAWAATFGRTVTEIEMAPTGGGSYRQATRFAKFQNVPEMLRLWHVFADVKTAEDLMLPTPDLAVRGDGQRLPETVLVPATDATRAYVADLGARAELVRSRAVDPTQDNMLKISTDGRKAALDMRLVDPDGASSPGPTKLDVVADRVAGIWSTHRDSEYLDPATGRPAAARGALQIVFCDLGTPSGRWNAYEELRDQLARRGVPREQVRFIHEAANDGEKSRLFAAARSGQVAVIVGSTAKMGVGTNIQSRAVALHHVDCPWRPADLEQRDGRLLRQGNQNPEVQVVRYATEGSFDAYSWQTVERKAKFIAQVMRGRLDVREMEDVGDNALSFAEVKALASGDPLILEKAQTDNDRTRLERLARAHTRNQSVLHRALADIDRRIDSATTDLPLLRAATDASTDTRGQAFRMVVGGHPTASRTQAAELVQTWLADHHTVARHGAIGRAGQALGEMGEAGGHTIEATHRPTLGKPPAVVLTLRGVPGVEVVIDGDRAGEDGLGGGVVRQLENRVRALPDVASKVEDARTAAAAERDQVRAGLDRPFKHAEALTAARARSAEITAAMERNHAPDTPADAENGPGTDGPPPDPELAATMARAGAGFPDPARAAAQGPKNGPDARPRTAPDPAGREPGDRHEGR
jgi:N12 class adenine-specific DNA methylase